MNAFRSLNFDLEHIRARDVSCLGYPALQTARLALEKKYEEFQLLLGNGDISEPDAGPSGRGTATQLVATPVCFLR